MIHRAEDKWEILAGSARGTGKHKEQNILQRLRNVLVTYFTYVIPQMLLISSAKNSLIKECTAYSQMYTGLKIPELRNNWSHWLHTTGRT